VQLSEHPEACRGYSEPARRQLTAAEPDGPFSSHARRIPSALDRAYPLRQLPKPRPAAIAALNDAAVTIEFCRAITAAGSVSISLRLQVITHRFLVVSRAR
jgi:hypothetical protein